MKMKKIQRLFLYLVGSASVVICFLIFSLDQFENERSIKLKSCFRIPQESEIFIDNLIWQVLETRLGFLKLYNAYLDTRWNETVVRVNSNGPKMNITEDQLYCQFFFDDETSPSVVKASEYLILWSKGKKTYYKQKFDSFRSW